MTESVVYTVGLDVGDALGALESPLRRATTVGDGVVELLPSCGIVRLPTG